MITRRQFLRMPLWRQTEVFFQETEYKLSWQVAWFSNWRKAIRKFAATL